MKPLFILHLCSLTILSSVIAAPADDADKLVLAGERIGQVQLNMEDAKLDKLLGEPTTGEGSMGGRASETWCSKSPDGQRQQTIVDTYGTRDPAGKILHPKVTRVLVTSPFFHTPAGVSTKSELTAIWQEFPDLQYAGVRNTKDGVPMELYASVANGIGFAVERFAQPASGKPWGMCHAIIVFPRGEQVEAPYLGDCEPIQ